MIITCASDRCDVQVVHSHTKQKYCSAECKKYEKGRRKREKRKAAGLKPSQPYVKKCPICDCFFRCNRNTRIHCSYGCMNGSKRIASRDERKRIGKEGKEARKRHEWVMTAGVAWAVHTTKPVCRTCKQCKKSYVAFNQKSRFCDSCVKQRNAMQRKEAGVRRRARKKSLFPLIERFTRKEIFERDNYLCQLCGAEVKNNVDPRSPIKAHLDHIIPLAKGGLHTRNNVQCLCRVCNESKADKLL